MREDVSLLVPVPAGATKAALTVSQHAIMAHHVTIMARSARILRVRGVVGTLKDEKSTREMTRAALTAAALAALAGCADAFAVPTGLPTAWNAAAARRAPISLRQSVRMAETSAEPLSRKGRNKLKKATKTEETAAKKKLRAQVDTILDELFDEIEAEKRDLKKVRRRD